MMNAYRNIRSILYGELIGGFSSIHFIRINVLVMTWIMNIN